MNNAFRPIYRILLTVFFSCLSLYSQSSRYETLATSWQHALAGGGAALSPSAAGIWKDPSYASSQKFSAESHISFLPADIQLSQLSLQYRALEKISFSVGINTEDHGTFDRRDDSGLLTGQFHSGQNQYLINASLQLSQRLSLGYSYRRASLDVDNRKFLENARHLGFRLKSADSKNTLVFSSIDWSGEDKNIYTLSLARELEYLPVTLSIDHRFEGKRDISNTRISAHILAQNKLNYFAGLNLERINLQTRSLAEDLLSGLGAGAAYHWRDLVFYFSLYHYGGPGMSSSMGLSWSLGKEE